MISYLIRLTCAPLFQRHCLKENETAKCVFHWHLRENILTIVLHLSWSLQQTAALALVKADRSCCIDCPLIKLLALLAWCRFPSGNQHEKEAIQIN